jgi:broad specificity phosphatase PhoE
VERLVIARHAEAESNLAETVSGLAPGGSLTPAGLEQARALGRALAGDDVGLAVVTELSRTAETVDAALDGRAVPRLVLPDLNEIRFGRFEGGLLGDYRAWAWSAPAGELCPGGGDSRGEAAARYARAFAALLERPEATVLAVTHAVPIRYLLRAVDGLPPQARIDPVPHAEPFRLDATAVARAADLLAAWSREPAFADPPSQ